MIVNENAQLVENVGDGWADCHEQERRELEMREKRRWTCEHAMQWKRTKIDELFKYDSRIVHKAINNWFDVFHEFRGLLCMSFMSFAISISSGHRCRESSLSFATFESN